MHTYSLIAALMFFSNVAFADFYMGASAGQTSYSEPTTHATSLEISGGYHLTSFLALEVSWMDWGEERLNDTGDKTGFQMSGAQASTLLVVPMSEYVDLYWKYGRLFWQSESSYNSHYHHNSSTAYRSNSSDLMGLGFFYYLDDAMALRTSYQFIKIDGEEVGNVSAGFTIHF